MDLRTPLLVLFALSTVGLGGLAVHQHQEIERLEVKLRRTDDGATKGKRGKGRKGGAAREGRRSPRDAPKGLAVAPRAADDSGTPAALPDRVARRAEAVDAALREHLAARGQDPALTEQALALVARGREQVVGHMARAASGEITREEAQLAVKESREATEDALEALLGEEEAEALQATLRRAGGRRPGVED